MATFTKKRTNGADSSEPLKKKKIRLDPEKESKAVDDLNHPHEVKKIVVKKHSGDGGKHDTRSTNSLETNSKTESLSLHVSQLPFDITKPKLAAYFEAHGCVISQEKGVRLCHNSDGDLSGVAFVDFADKKSVVNGLKLHRSRFGGRLINVRPTKSKEELAQIVAEKEKKLISQGLDFKVKELNKPRQVVKGRNIEMDTGFDKSEDAKKTAKKLAKSQAAKETLASREKWSRSKKARERAKQKKHASSSQ